MEYGKGRRRNNDPERQTNSLPRERNSEVEDPQLKTIHETGP
jgi:hypothetical protein